MSLISLIIKPPPNTTLTNQNHLYVSPQTYSKINTNLILIHNYLFSLKYNDQIANNTIAMNKAQREFLNKLVDDKLEIEMFDSKQQQLQSISLLNCTVSLLNREKIQLEKKEVQEYLVQSHNNMPFNINQCFYLPFNGLVLRFTVKDLLFDGAISKKEDFYDKNSINNYAFGVLTEFTTVHASSISANLTLTGNVSENILLKNNFNFETLGIGGLQKEFGLMFRRAIVQRVYSQKTISQLGIKHIKGIILYGPPGTGKTLIARNIGQLLNSKTPKIVNGPEVLNKYVGQSEENIRNLFKEAEEEYALKGDKSALHIIIFDEIDAICKSRGNSMHGDQVVNQLLSKMDGVECVNNVLVIGMTNRFDMLDKALLRPGRFEIHIEINLPDVSGRLEILKIHTNDMKNSKFMSEDVNLTELSEMTRNYTGAEIAAVVKSAASFALERKVKLNEKRDTQTNDKLNVDENKELLIVMNDFLLALEEVKPSFGVNEKDFNVSKKFYEWPNLLNALQIGSLLTKKLLSTLLYNTTSILFYGLPGTGKTRIAQKLAMKSNFPYVKMIKPAHLIGMSEIEKVNFIKEIFEDAYKSEQAVVILDDIEGIVEFVPIGPRFLNTLLQAIKLYTKDERDNKLLVIGTANDYEFITESKLSTSFDKIVEIRKIDEKEFEILKKDENVFKNVVFDKEMGIRELLGCVDREE